MRGGWGMYDERCESMTRDGMGVMSSGRCIMRGGRGMMRGGGV